MQKSKKKFFKKLFSILFLFCCVQVTVPLLVGCNEAQQPTQKFTEEIQLDIERKVKDSIDTLLNHDNGFAYQVVCTFTDTEMKLVVDLKEFFPYLKEYVMEEIDEILETDYPDFVFQDPTTEGTTIIYIII